jgi:hypothetical protein
MWFSQGAAYLFISGKQKYACPSSGIFRIIIEKNSVFSLHLSYPKRYLLILNDTKGARRMCCIFPDYPNPSTTNISNLWKPLLEQGFAGSETAI